MLGKLENSRAKIGFLSSIATVKRKILRGKLVGIAIAKIKTNFRASPTNDACKIQPEGPRGTG
jgi:hypothetical protein